MYSVRWIKYGMTVISKFYSDMDEANRLARDLANNGENVIGLVKLESGE